MAEHNYLGRWGENIAVDYLVSKGYAIVETNWRLNHLEIDIIATKGSRIVFVEVKTRSSRIVDPLLAIDRKRVSHMVAAADVYVRANNIPHEVQFDLILIIGDAISSSYELEHIPDAFFPPRRGSRPRWPR